MDVGEREEKDGGEVHEEDGKALEGDDIGRRQRLGGRGTRKTRRKNK